MAFGLADGISFTAASSGTGNFVLGSSRASFRTLAQAVTDGSLVDGQTVSYLAQDSLSAPTQREWGRGVFHSATNTVDRTTILGTGAGGTTAVSFSAPPIVSLTALAEDLGTPGVTFGEAVLYRDGAANTLAEGNGANATALRVYNTTDQTATNIAPTNYERGVFDWTTTANVLTIGGQVGGTGTARNVRLVSGAGISMGQPAGGPQLDYNVAIASCWTMLNGNTGQHIVLSSDDVIVEGGGASNCTFCLAGSLSHMQFSSASAMSTPSLGTGTRDAGLCRAAAKVIELTDGTAQNSNGWLNYGGQARVTSDVTATSTTVLATATGLSVALQAGRTYSFEVHLSFTDAAAGGIQAAMVATGGLTATNIIYDGYIVDSGANGIKGNAQATALGGVVASSTTVGTAGCVKINGTITVNVAGTINVQFAQNTSSGTATTVKRGSYMIIHDMP